MTTVLYDTIVSRVATVVPMFAKAIVDSALEGADLTPARVTPVQMLRLLRDEIEPRIRKFSNMDGGLVSIGAAVVSIGRDGSVVRIDPMARILLDLGRDLPPQDGAVMERLLEIGLGQASAGDSPIVREVRLKGSGRVVNVAWAPLKDPDGGTAGRTAVIQDVTLRVAMEEAVLNYEADLEAQHAVLDETNRRLAEASRRKSEFLARMSHEMRTPLHCIIGFNQLAIKEAEVGGGMEAARHLKTSTESAKDLLRIIEDVLDLSRVESGTIDLRMADLDLGALVAECVEAMHPLASEKGLAIEASRPDRPVVVRSDRFRIKQVMINLLGNAVKFTDGGRISVTVSEGDGEARIGVADTGIGIPEGEIGRVFDDFYQVDESTTRAYQGTGMGLALSRKLVLMLGGRIEVESELGRGSTFTVALPRGTGTGRAG